MFHEEAGEGLWQHCVSFLVREVARGMQKSKELLMGPRESAELKAQTCRDMARSRSK